MTNAPSSPPGWYPDPAGVLGQRYWDGTTCTDNYSNTMAEHQRTAILQETLLQDVGSDCRVVAQTPKVSRYPSPGKLYEARRTII